MSLGGILYVYKGEWDLPSIDFECLRALCLVKFTRFPIKIQANGNLLNVGKLPYIKIGNETFVGYRQIKKMLDEAGYPIDKSLKGNTKQLSPAYANWVFTNLHAYHKYFLFGDPNNIDITRALYARRTPFPLNFYYPSTYQKEAKEVLMVMCGFDINDKIDNHESDYIVENAKVCVNLLSKKLGQKVWFFGNDFSEFDAIVYSYLAILYRITLPNNPLQNHIKGCQNLVNFINRISKDVFKDEAFNSIKSTKSSKKGEYGNVTLTPTERKLLESETKTKILAAIGAVIAMCTFAAWRGIYSRLSSTSYFDGYSDDDDADGNDDDMD